MDLPSQQPRMREPRVMGWDGVDGEQGDLSGIMDDDLVGPEFLNQQQEFEISYGMRE
jgi:hypothetical protein